MARRGSFRRSGVSQSQRRKKTWISLKAATGAVDADASAFQTSLIMTSSNMAAKIGGFAKVARAAISVGDAVVGDEQSSFPEESTILRARGSLLFPKIDVGSVGVLVDQQFAFGFGVTDLRSLTEGSFPGPIIDSDWDGWMFLRQSTVSAVDSIGTVVDVKAMRKIQTGDAFFVAAETVSGDGVTLNFGTWVFDLRLLILLP